MTIGEAIISTLYFAVVIYAIAQRKRKNSAGIGTHR